MESFLLATLINATVLQVLAGDRLQLQINGQQHSIALACIDAPHGNQGGAASISRQQLKALLPVGNRVLLQHQGLDREGGTAMEVYRPGTHEPVNLQLVQRGWAFAQANQRWHCRRYPYGDAESEARRRGIGLWSWPE